MSNKFKKGFAKLMPLSMIAILVSGFFVFFATQILPMVFAETAAGFTVNNYGASTHKGGDSAVAMELVLPTPATDTAVAGLTVAGTPGLATFPAGWAMYGYSAGAGQFNAAADWIGTDDDSDGFYTSQADSAADCDGSATAGVGSCTALAAGATLVPLAGTENLCTDSLTAPTVIYVDGNSNCTSGDFGTDVTLRDDGGGGGIASATISVGTYWSFVDEGGGLGTWDDGEDLIYNGADLNGVPDTTWSAAADTLIAGTAPSHGAMLADMNSAKPAGWTQLLINDGGTAGTWEVGSDMIFTDLDNNLLYNADALTSILFGNPGSCMNTDIAKFEVFEDTNGNGIYDAGTDVSIASNSSAPFISTPMVATGSIYTAASNERTIFFVVTFAAAPTNGCTFTALLPNTGSAPYAAQFASGDDGPTDADVDTTDTITIDSVTPSFAVTTKTVDSDANGTVDQIVVDFSENVNIIDTGAAGDGISSLAVSGGCTTIDNGDYSVSGASTVTLNVSGCTPNDTSITPTVTYTAVADCTANGSICDMVGNQMANAANQVAADGAAPAFLTREYLDHNNDGVVDRLNVVFSENVWWDTPAMGQFAIVNQGLTGYDSNGTPNSLGGGGGGSTNIWMTTDGTTNLTGVSGGTEPTVRYTQSGTVAERIRDAANNYTVSDGGPVSMTDSANPILVSASTTSDRDITLVFSEAISATGLAGSDLSTNSGANAMDSVAGGGTNTITWSTATAGEYWNTDATGASAGLGTDATGTNRANVPDITISADAFTDDSAAANGVITYSNDTRTTDGAAPAFVTAAATSDTNVRIQMSEVVNSVTFGAATDWTATGITSSGVAINGTNPSQLDLTVNSLGNTAFMAANFAFATASGGDIQDAATNATAAFSSKTINDGQAPVFVSAAATSNTNVQIQMSEAINAVNFGATADWTAAGMTSSAVAINADPTKLDLTVDPLGNTAFTAADFAFTTANGSYIRDAIPNATAAFSGKAIADAQAPVLVGAQPVLALKQDGTAPAIDTNVWYYYGGDSLRFTVTASEPLNEVRACVRSLTGDNSALTCDPTEFTTGTLNTDFISTSTTSGGFTYSFNVALAALMGTPTGVDGYPINIRLEDANANMGYGTTDPETFVAVFNVVPTTIDVTLGGTTTNWSTIADYTAATNLIFEKAGNIGKLEFAGPINLTEPATINALQALSTNVITGGDDPTGASILGIHSDNLTAFDTAATLTAHMPSAVRPGLIVYDNAGTQIGTVPNDQAGDIVVDGNTLGTFNWNAGAQTMSWTTTGFSSFGTDSTGPIVTDGNISIAGATGTGGAYKIGDTVTVTWNNSATGDNNGADFSSATASLTAFGGGAAVAMTDTAACGGTASDDIFEACYTIDGTEGIDDINLNAVITAYDAVGNPTTTADISNATVDTIVPVIGTPGSLTITLDNNANSVANIGDTVTYNNAVAGAPDGDTYKVDLTALTGDAAATNAGSPYAVILGTLTGNQTFTETVTDNAGNTATGVTQALAVDNRSLLTATNVTPASAQTSASTTYTFAFTTNTNWPADGKLKVTFPAGFNVAALDTQVADNLSNVDGVLTVTDVTGQVVTITRDGTGAIVPPSTAVSLRVGSGTNPATAGVTGTFTFLTTTAGDVSIDIDDAVPGVNITAPPAPPADPEPTTTGGGGGGGGQTSPASNTTTSTIASDIETVNADQTYSRPVEFKEESMVVNTDDNTVTVQATGDNGTLTIKPNAQSTISLTIPSGTSITADASWNGRINPPLIRSLTNIHSSGEEIEGTNDKLMRSDVAVLIEVGGNVPLTFSNEVTLKIPVDLPNGSVINVYSSGDGDTWKAQGTAVVQNGFAIIKTNHLSYYALEMTDKTADLVDALEEAEEAAGAFGDIAGHWAESYINNIANLGIVSGKTATQFAPNDNITRAELTKIVMNAFAYTIAPSVNATDFIDVLLSEWFAPYVVAARNAGVIQGYQDGTFKPNTFINRAEALKILIEAAGFVGVEENYNTNYGNKEGYTFVFFPDVLIGEWFSKYVAYAKDFNIVGGYSDGTFGPGNYMTRAEVAKVVTNILDMQ